jgi:hypothetical protein
VPFLDIELDGMSGCRSLNEQATPLACMAIWEALPFDGTAVYAQISGDMFRILEPVPVVEDLPVEDQGIPNPSFPPRASQTT